MMTETLTRDDRALFEKPNVAHLATVRADGGPQVSPVWVDLDGDLILVNSARGRAKVRNVERDPRVAISVADRDEPRTRLLVRGRVVEISEEGAVEHINALAHKYEGTDYDGMVPGMVRVILKIEAEWVSRVRA